MSSETSGDEATQMPVRDPRGSAWPRGLFLAVVALAFVVAGFWLGARFGPRVEALVAPHRPGPPTLGAAPDYTLTDQTGRTVHSRDFAGKVRVVTFIFPYCRTYCPLITAHLVGFERLLASAGVADRVQLVAFNLAPDDARPAEMRTFLKQYGWAPADRHWEYLTGSAKAIRRIVTGGYHVAYDRVDNSAASAPASTAETPQPEVVNPLADRVKPGYDISHNDALIVVDGHGRIRRIFDQADVLSNQTLWRTVRALLGAR